MTAGRGEPLQGRIWEEGYLSGALRAHVYADVPRALARWRGRGLRTAIFSSGSVLAQRLLFAHTVEGDLSTFIAAGFDTTTGPKREAPSYRRIAERRGKIVHPGMQIESLIDNPDAFDYDHWRALGGDEEWFPPDETLEEAECLAWRRS